MGVPAGWETCACWRIRKEVSWLSLSRVEQLHGGLYKLLDRRCVG